MIPATALALVLAWSGLAACHRPLSATKGASVDAGTAPGLSPTSCTRGGPPLTVDDPASLGPGFADLNAVAAGDGVLALTDNPANAIPNAILFADLDGDGQMELVFGNQPLVAMTYDRATKSLINRRPLNTDTAAVRDALAVVDFDGDGTPDILGLSDGNINWGRPGGSGTYEAGQTFASGLSGALVGAALVDFDNDGWLDILAGVYRCPANCPANLVPLLRVAPRAYEPHPEWIPATTPGANPAALFVTSFHAGELVIATIGSSSSLSTQNFMRQTSTDDLGFPGFENFDPMPSPEPSLCLTPGAPLSAYAPMGAAIADLDGDGRLDMAFNIDPLALFHTGNDDWPMTDVTRKVDIWDIETEATRWPKIPWSTALIDFDGDGFIDNVTTHGDDTRPLGLIGPQYTTFHRGRGALVYEDATQSSHLGRVGQWRALTVTDLEGDGDADLAVGGFGTVPRAFRNDVATGGHSLSIRLHGTTSNHLGVGARVWVQAVAGGPLQLLVPDGVASPGSLSEPIAFAGLGSATSASLVRVAWPSGFVQEVHGLPAGQSQTIVEPETVGLLPAQRHVLADGTTQATIRLTPRLADGSVNTATVVGLQITGEGGALTAPVLQPDGSWLATLTAPTTPGIARLHVTFDGQELPIHPKIWWDGQ